jgi:benzoate/toluate 1,2-dioxygenase reductase subunit
MAYRIALNFEDGATRFIDCNVGEKVLDAAYRAQVNLPMDCSDGVCGTCKCRCEQGEYDLGDEYIEDALTEDEAGERLVLTCQMVPSSDCVIAVPVSTSACKITSADIEVEVVGVDLLSDHRIKLSVKAVSAGLPHFLAGQYVNIGVPEDAGVSRSYSFSSRPGADLATFIIRNVEGGRMSSYLEQRAKPGDRLTLRGPLGSFYLRPARRPMLFIAGGTGISPILSMLEVLGEEGARGHAVSLIYGVHDAADLVEMERIEALQKVIPEFTVTTTVSGPGSTHPRVGRVTAHFAGEHLNGGDIDVYLCGPPDLVEVVREHIAASDITPAGLHYEKFIPAQAEVQAA